MSGTEFGGWKNTFNLVGVITQKPLMSVFRYICEKGMFQDFKVKFQVHLYLRFDFDVLKHTFFLRMVTFVSEFP